MAKDGVSFRSKNQCARNSNIQIAVPFSPEDQKVPAIFVRARLGQVWGGVFEMTETRTRNAYTRETNPGLSKRNALFRISSFDFGVTEFTSRCGLEG